MKYQDGPLPFCILLSRIWSVLLSALLMGTALSPLNAQQPEKPVAEPKPLAIFSGHKHEIHAVAFSPDGKTLATAEWSRQYLEPGVVKLWDVATGKERAVLKGHKQGVMALATSSDGKTIATGSHDHTVKLWDYTGKQLREHRCKQIVWAVAFSPDGNILAAGSDSREVTLWNVASGKEARTLSTTEGGNIAALAFSPDRSKLAVGFGMGNPSSGRVELWDVVGNSKPVLFRSGPNHVTSLVFSPDGKTLAIGVGLVIPGTVQLWDVVGAKQRHICKGHTAPVTGVAFAADGKTVFSGGYEERRKQGVLTWTVLRVWDVATGKEVGQLTAPDLSRLRTPLAIAPGGKTLAAGTGQTVHLWAVPTCSQPRILQGHRGKIQSLLFDKDGKTLVVGSDRLIQDGAEVKVWDLTTFKELTRFQTSDYQMSLAALLPDQRLLILGQYQDKSMVTIVGPAKIPVTRYAIRLWDMTKGKELALFPTPPLTRNLFLFVPPNRKPSLMTGGGAIAVAALSADKKLLALGSLGKNDKKETIFEVKLWDVDTGKERIRPEPLPLRLDFNAVLGFTAGNKQLCFASQGGPITTWDTATGKVVNTWKLPAGHSPRQLSPDGAILVTAHDEHQPNSAEVKFWDITTGKERARFAFGFNPGLIFSPNGQTLAVFEGAGKVALWDMSGGKISATFQANKDDWGRLLSFSLDNKLLVTVGQDRLLRVWEVQTGKARVALKCHFRYLHAVVFSPDGRTLAVGGGDEEYQNGEVELLNVPAGSSR